MASVTIFDQMSIGPHVQLIGLRARDTCKQWSCDWSLVTSGDLDLWITLILQVNVRTSLQLFRSKLIVIAKQVSNEFVTRERHGKRIGLYISGAWTTDRLGYSLQMSCEHVSLELRPKITETAVSSAYIQ